VAFDAVITSPLVRARETADGLLAGFADPKPPLQMFDEIGYDVRPRKIVKFLERLTGEAFAIIGHQPKLSRFAAWLIGDKNVNLELEKAGFATVGCPTWEKGSGTLIQLVTRNGINPLRRAAFGLEKAWQKPRNRFTAFIPA